jgi:opacity protein-like surface antigen
MTRTTARAVVAAGALSAAALVSAASAAAAVAPNGRYSVVGGSDQFYVTITSNCATEGCTAKLVSNRGWTSVATLTGGRWSYSVTKPDGVICADGNYANVVIRYSVDADTMAGTVLADSNGECPGGQVTQFPVQLTRIG